jgi:hypothetical protein
MISFAIASLVAGMIFASGMLGLLLQKHLPKPHTSDRSRDMIGSVVGTSTLLRSRRWSESRVIAGRSRTVSRPPRTSLGSITRPGPGTGGIVTSHLSCSPSPSGQSLRAQKNRSGHEAKASGLIRWSIQEIHRIAQRLARKRIQPAYIIAWSLWRRAHQAAAQKAHRKMKSRL